MPGRRFKAPDASTPGVDGEPRPPRWQRHREVAARRADREAIAVFRSAVAEPVGDRDDQLRPRPGTLDFEPAVECPRVGPCGPPPGMPRSSASAIGLPVHIDERHHRVEPGTERGRLDFDLHRLSRRHRYRVAIDLARPVDPAVDRRTERETRGDWGGAQAPTRRVTRSISGRHRR